MDLGGFNRFLEIHRRHDRGNALGEHAFAAAGGANHENIVSSCDGNFYGAFGGVLAAYVGEIDLVLGEVVFKNRGVGRFQRLVAVQEPEDLSEEQIGSGTEYPYLP